MKPFILSFFCIMFALPAVGEQLGGFISPLQGNGGKRINTQNIKTSSSKLPDDAVSDAGVLLGHCRNNAGRVYCTGRGTARVDACSLRDNITQSQFDTKVQNFAQKNCKQNEEILVRENGSGNASPVNVETQTISTATQPRAEQDCVADPNKGESHRKWNSLSQKCELIYCNTPLGYKKSSDGTKCEKVVCRANTGAGETESRFNPRTEQCEVTSCNTPKYKLIGGKCVNQEGAPCTVDNAISAKYAMRHGKLVCEPQCKDGFLPTDGKCTPRPETKTVDLKIDNKKEPNRSNTTASYTQVVEEEIAEENAENQVGKPCTADNAKTATYQLKNGKVVCYATACSGDFLLENGKCKSRPNKTVNLKIDDVKKQSGTNTISSYTPVDDEEKLVDEDNPMAVGKPCAVDNAKTATYQLKNGKVVCYATACSSGYLPGDGKCTKAPNTPDNVDLKIDNKKEPNRSNTTASYTQVVEEEIAEEKAENQVGKPCAADNAKTATYQLKNGNVVCIIETCENGYLPGDNKCTKAPDTPDVDLNIDDKKEPNENNITASYTQVSEEEIAEEETSLIGKECTENGKTGTYKLDEQKKALVCDIVDSSDSDTAAGTTDNSATEETADTPIPTKTTDDNSTESQKEQKKDKKTAAPRSEEEKALAQERISDLKDNAKALKDNRESAANKALTGAAIGTVGGGLMMTLQGSAEQNADKKASDDMSAYISSFRCDYGKGQNITGGQTSVELPGINALTKMFSEYATLAGEIKAKKESLGLAPGIESELVLDASNVGLYDDKSLGITDGHYASLARAIMNPNSEDAAEIAEMQKKSKTMKTAGIVMTAVGAAGSVVGNALINKNAPKNDADDINKKYDDKLKDLKSDQLSQQKEECEKQTGKLWQDSKCVDDPAYLKSQEQKECTAKGADYEWNGRICVNKKTECENDLKKEWKGGQCVDKVVEVEQEKPDEQPETQKTTDQGRFATVFSFDANNATIKNKGASFNQLISHIKSNPSEKLFVLVKPRDNDAEQTLATNRFNAIKNAITTAYSDVKNKFCICPQNIPCKQGAVCGITVGASTKSLSECECEGDTASASTPPQHNR